MLHPTAVLNVVGLNTSLIGEHTPNLRNLVQQGQLTRLKPVLPAVTCTVQTSMVTGLPPSQHGVVANGWYHRDLAEVRFWHRSNNLVHGEKLWQTARQRDPAFTCANLFWWYNTHADCDIVLNVRPIYKADGRKLPDCYSEPAEIRDRLQDCYGQFPLFNFWGPMANIQSSRWIADAAMHIHREHRPTLTLVYLPHLDYDLQKLGPEHPNIKQAATEIDTEVGRLVDYFHQQQVRVLVVSEYGIEPVTEAVAINRVLRTAGALYIREEEGLEMVEPGASEAFAVTDHQVAHVYVKDPANVDKYAQLCRGVEGVEQVLDRQAQAKIGLDHERAGELVLVAEPDRWFVYDYWFDDDKAPDFARTVDIHRKPGYDPRELFIDPRFKHPRFQIAWRLLRSKGLNLRTLMDVIPLDTRLVKGSHGRTEQQPDYQPVLITPNPIGDHEPLPCQSVRDVILSSLFDEQVGLPTDASADQTSGA